MIVLWSLIFALPLLAFGGAMVLSPEKTRCFTDWFRRGGSGTSENAFRPLTIFLVAFAWLWTAYEIDTLGIAAIDGFTKAFPGEPWVLAACLIPLTLAWMPQNLPVRALTGILMLLPAELFKTTRLYLPEAGTWFAATDFIVLTAYLGAVVGMYGMFYPWRLEKGMNLVLDRPALARSLGVVLAVLGLTIAIIGVTL